MGEVKGTGQISISNQVQVRFWEPSRATPQGKGKPSLGPRPAHPTQGPASKCPSPQVSSFPVSESVSRARGQVGKWASRRASCGLCVCVPAVVVVSGLCGMCVRVCLCACASVCEIV